MPYTRLMDKVVERHPLVPVLQFQTLCSKSSAGRLRMTSSEKGTKQKEESCPYILYQQRKVFQEVALDFPAPPSEFTGACS